MVLAELRQKFRGREFWRTINRVIGFGLYSVVIIGVMAFPMYLIYVFFVMAVVVPSYVALFINHLREMEKRDKGSKVVEGWITHAYGVGERIYLYPTKFELVEKLSPADVISVKQYVKNLDKQSPKTGLERYKEMYPEPPKQLEHKEIEDMNNAERKKFNDAERDEYNKYADEHRKIIELEEIDRNEKPITKDGDDPKDE